MCGIPDHCVPCSVCVKIKFRGAREAGVTVRSVGLECSPGPRLSGSSQGTWEFPLDLRLDPSTGRLDRGGSF
jgi:hypothetical protein